MFPQICMVELHFDKFLDPSAFQCWKMNFKTEVCSCSGFWCGDYVVDHRGGGGQIDGRSYDVAVHWRVQIPELDAKIACALKKIIPNPYFKRRVRLEEQKAQTQDRFLRDRQVAHMIYEHFQVTGAHEAVLDLADLFLSLYKVTFFTILRCDQALLSTSEMAQDKVLWKVCTRCEFKGLSNSEQYWQCTIQKLINIFEIRR